MTREELISNLKQAQDEEAAAKAAVVSADLDFARQSEILSMARSTLELSTSVVGARPSTDDDTTLSSLVAVIAIAERRLSVVDDAVKAARITWNEKRDNLTNAQNALQG